MVKVQYKNFNELIPYENNPRFNDNAVESVANSIKEFGFINPVIIDSNNVIIAGHTRYKACSKLGITQIPVIVASDLTPEQIRAFRLADNKTGELADWDLDKLQKELIELEFAIDMSEFGFVDESEFDDINPDDFDDDFELNSGDEPEFHQLSVIVHTKQLELIQACIESVHNNGEVNETFGNTNHKGNGLFEVVRQWAEQRKLL